MSDHKKIIPRNWTLSQVGITLACLFFIIPLCALPPARLGYYSQVETSIMACWSLSSGSCLWLCFLWKKNPRLVYQISKLPIVWGPILLGLTTILLSPFHLLPLRNFVGSGQIGEGALTFIASGIMAGHFSILTRISFYRKVLFGSALVVALIISTLTIIGSMDSPFFSWRYWIWSPFTFPDFLAFIDIALLATYFYMRTELKGLIYLYDIIALSLFIFVGYHAHNKSLTFGMIIAGFAAVAIRMFPNPWRRLLLQVCFFSLSLTMTLLIVFYDEVSSLLAEPLKSMPELATLTSRTWLSKVALVDLWYVPITEHWISQILVGNGWGTFGNISAANMFLIDQISLFSGKEYQPSWELINRDLMHTHNILTSLFHSVGLTGVSLYLYTQYKLINSLSQNFFLLGTAYLIAYQIQLLFWFQFLMTIPFTLLALSLLFKERVPTLWTSVLKPRFLQGFAGCLLIFTLLQGFIAIGYKKGLMRREVESNTEYVDVLTTAPYVYLEAAFGAQRQVGLARIYSLEMQKEFEKSPEKFVTHSLRLVNHLNSLPKGGNYLANTLALNILSELASKPETLKWIDAKTLKTWEHVSRDHIRFMPYRSDILLPFFNLCQTLGKGPLVLELTEAIIAKNPRDPIALWFMGSSLLQTPSRFEEGMCILQKSIHSGIERFMPVSPTLKSKIFTQAKLCP